MGGANGSYAEESGGFHADRLRGARDRQPAAQRLGYSKTLLLPHAGWRPPTGVELLSNRPGPDRGPSAAPRIVLQPCLSGRSSRHLARKTSKKCLCPLSGCVYSFLTNKAHAFV